MKEARDRVMILSSFQGLTAAWVLLNRKQINEDSKKSGSAHFCLFPL
jgi:hypothetical protein